jgi:indole-3-glycerol phosphate synthase
MNRLDEIVAVKRAEVEQLRKFAEHLGALAIAVTDFRGFTAAIKRPDDQLAIIAEVKKASPSAGVIESNYNPAEKAQDYQRQGAEAISVLTDKTFFQGSVADLTAVHDAVSIPVLRKDFVVDELQVLQAAAAGADAVLIIVAAVNPKQLLRLMETAVKLHLETLVEIHTQEEIQKAMDVGATLIGINNRDLTTFEVDLSVTEHLSELIPNDIVLVSESGYKTAKDVLRAHRCGVDAILVGEALMRSEINVNELRVG